MAGTECDSCHAPIFWRRHIRTRIPTPINIGPDPAGNLKLVGEGEYAVVANQDREGFALAGGLLFKSHYATCPNAPTWHTGRKK